VNKQDDLQRALRDIHRIANAAYRRSVGFKEESDAPNPLKALEDIRHIARVELEAAGESLPEPDD
jgi:hypothetical protein